MSDLESDHLPDPLAPMVEELRRAEAVRPEWRAEVLRRAAVPDARRVRVSLTIPWAIAAGVLCAVAGGATVFAVLSHAMRGGGAAPTVAIERRAAPTTLPVRFSVVAPSAARVSIVGDFDHWDPAALPMRRSADGRMWEVEVRLPLGLYTYAFMIDGRLAPDPDAPHAAGNDFGTANSVLVVRGS